MSKLKLFLVMFLTVSALSAWGDVVEKKTYIPCSSSSYSYTELYYLNALRQAFLFQMAGGFTDPLALFEGMALSSSIVSSSAYTESELPEWTVRTGIGVSWDSLKYQTNPARIDMAAEGYTTNLTLSARKERVLVIMNLRYEELEGKDSFEDMDTTTYGATLMPGYYLLMEEEDFVTMAVFGIADIAFVDADGAQDQWRVMPGLGASVSRMTPVGNFSMLYAFTHSRNTTADNELTGGRYINFHNAMARYYLPIAEKFYVATSLSYTYAAEIPRNIENEFTTVRVEAGAFDLGNFDISVGIYTSIDSSENHGADVKVGYTW